VHLVLGLCFFVVCFVCLWVVSVGIFFGLCWSCCLLLGVVFGCCWVVVVAGFMLVFGVWMLGRLVGLIVWLFVCSVARSRL
jgi:hypothetical protein